nr:retrovirus-related Pol polyprotein from transposon TNT 1-94 [Tanacetum cinerariifolium]
MSRSVPAIVSRSVPAVESRSVPAVVSRSVPSIEPRSVPAVVSRSFPAVVSRSTELSAEQAFWSRYSVQFEEPTLSSSTTIVEVLKELPKVSMVNSSLKKLKFHLAIFDMVVKERTTTTAITKGTWGFEHTKACFRDEIIPFAKALKELFNSFDRFLIDELTEVQNIFKQMKQAVEQHFIVKLKERLKSLTGDVKEEKIKMELEEIETINIELDHRVTKLVAKNEYLKQTYKQLYDLIKSSRVRSKEQCDDLIKQVNIKSVENSNLNASLQEKVLVIAALKETLSKLKGKAVVNEAVTLHPIDPELLKLDVAPLAPKLCNNKIAHTDYLRHTQEETTTLREIVKRKLQPKDDIGIFIGYASTKKAFWIYNRRTRRIFETIHVDFDELTAMASEQSSSGPALNEITPATISSGLVQKSSSSTPYVPPSRNDWDLLFQLMFDELLNPSQSVDHHAPEVITPIVKVIPPIPADSTGSPSSTTVDQDAPSPMEPKTYKEALTQSCWIEAIQEELNEFERIEVWELVPCPDKVMVITLKWIYKVKLDELGGILKNKARLVARGYRQEEGIDFEESFASASKTKSWLWHRRFSYLNFGAINHLARQGLVRGLPKLKFEKDHLCSACAMGKSKLQPKADIGIFIGYAPTKKAFWIYNIRTRRIVETIHVDFDELTAMASEQTESIGLPSSTLVDQDAPSPSKSQTTPETKSAIIPQDVEEDNIDIEVAHIGNDQLFGVPIPVVTSAQSSSTAFPHTIVENGVIELYFVNTEYQLADLFTKALGRDRTEFLINKLGMRSFTPETLKQLMDEVDEQWWYLFTYPVSYNSTDDEGDDDEGKDGDGDEEYDSDDGREVDGDDDEDDDGEEGDDDDDDQEVVRDDDKDDEKDNKEEVMMKAMVKRILAYMLVRKKDMMKRKRKMNYKETSILIKEGQSSSVSSQFVTSMLNSTLDVAQKNDEFLKTIDENMQNIIKEQVKEQVKVQVSKILPRIEQTVNEQLEAEVLTRSSHSSKTSYVVAADLSETELKKILIEKIKGNKETVTLKRCQDDDDADKDEEPSTGSDRGSKRRGEGKEPESARDPTETATRSAGRSTQGTKSRQPSASKSAFAEEPIDGTLTDVRTALDDRLKGIQMQYLPQSIWRKGDKDRAAAMI